MATRDSQRNLRTTLVWFTLGLWLLYFLVSVGASYDGRYEGGFRANTIEIYAGTCIVGVLVCAFLYRAFRSLWSKPTRRGIAVLAVVLLAVIFMHAFIEEEVWVALTNYPQRFWPQVWWMSVIYLWVYGAWVLGVSRLHASHQLREQQHRLAEAEATAQRATISALQSQLNPHFLFNALNTISALVVAHRVESAEATINKLSQLLRLTLEAGQQDFVDLDKELALVRAYLDIEGQRYCDRMTATISREPGLGMAMIPPILLQPLVENAVKHAVQPSAEPVTIEVTARRRDDCLVLQVENDGSPVGEDVPGFGIGLENIRRRLEALYGANASVTAIARAGGGFTTRLVLPYREAGEIAWQA